MSSIFIILTCIPLVLCVEQWDYFTFTQEWPPTVCIQGREEHHQCTIPKQVQGWGIHGLWPTKSGSEGPTSCNNSWPFNVKPIQELLPDLKRYWPNMYSDTSLTSFWEHEWDKHGTCATSLPATADEYKYFSTALKISQTYSASKLLYKHGITPSDTASYNYTDYTTALQQELGVQPVVQCAYDQQTKRHVVYEIEICLDKKTLKAVSCYTESNNSGKRFMTFEVVDILGKRSRHHHSRGPQSDCPKSERIYYPPIPGVDPALIG